MFSYPSDYSYSLQDLGENLTNEDVNGDFGSGAFYPVQWGVLPAHVWRVMDKGFLRFGSGRRRVTKDLKCLLFARIFC